MIMNTTRTQANWISAALSVLAIVVYLFTPFYRVLTFEISGYQLIGVHIAAVLPVLLGVVVTIGACLFPPVAAVICEGIHLLVVLLFMFLGNVVASSFIRAGLDVPIEWAAPINQLLAATPVVRPSWGAIVCLILCLSAAVVDVLANHIGKDTPQPEILQEKDDIFNSGLF